MPATHETNCFIDTVYVFRYAIIAINLKIILCIVMGPIFHKFFSLLHNTTCIMRHQFFYIKSKTMHTVCADVVATAAIFATSNLVVLKCIFLNSLF